MLVRLMGWGIVRGEREREGRIEEKKKSVENQVGTGFSY